MIYYWIPFLLAFFNCFINNKRFNDIASACCIIYMFAIVCLRDSTVGTDSERYAYGAEYGVFYENITEFVSSSLYLFSAYNKWPYTYVFSIMAAFLYVPTFYVICKTVGANLKYAVLLFIISNNIYFLDSLNAIRQLAACSLFFLASYLYIEKSPVNKYFRIVLITLVLFFAFGIHNAVIIYIPALLLINLRLSSKLVSKLLLLGLLYAFTFTVLINKSNLIDIINNFESILWDRGFSQYLTKDGYDGGFNIVGLAVLLIFPVYMAHKCYTAMPNNQYVKLYVYGLLLLCLAAPLTNIAVRITQGLIFFELITIPLSFSSLPSQGRIMVKMYLVLYSLYFAYQLVTSYSDPMELGPYKFCF